MFAFLGDWQSIIKKKNVHLATHTPTHTHIWICKCNQVEGQLCASQRPQPSRFVSDTLFLVFSVPFFILHTSLDSLSTSSNPYPGFHLFPPPSSLFFFRLCTISFLHTPVVTPFLSHLMLPPRPLHLSHLSCAIHCHFYWFFYYLSAHGLLNASALLPCQVYVVFFFSPQHLTFLSSFSPLFNKT